jgi:hypothetical protein
MSEFIEKSYREVTSRNPVGGDNFPQGLKDFKFSVGQGFGFIPAQSYFKITVTLNEYNGTPAIIKPANITFADGLCGNLFNNIYFNIGNQNVSSMTADVGQCEMLKHRLTKNDVYDNSIGYTQGFLGHYEDRQDLVSAAANTDKRTFYTVAKNKVTFIWKPALGIFDVSDPLGAGEYDIQLNPSQDYKLAAVQSALGSASLVAGAAANNIDFIVDDMRFYACMCRTNLPSSGVETLHLMEMAPLSISLPTGTATINNEITVPSSTRAITLAVQDQVAGKHTDVPSSRFHIARDSKEATRVTAYQLTYGSLTKPSTKFASAFTDAPNAASIGENTMQQRYVSTALESGQYFNPGGFESFPIFMERGPYYHESFIKSADNLATNVHVQMDVAGGFTRAARLLVFAHYSKTVQITRQNGLIVDVRALTV